MVSDLSENMTGPKKRNRTVYSCIRCRKRKLKCDRVRPCGQCTVSKAECVYQDQPKTPSAQKVSPISMDSIYSGNDSLPIADSGFPTSTKCSNGNCPGGVCPTGDCQPPNVYPSTSYQALLELSQGVGVDIIQAAPYWGRNHLMGLLMRDPVMAGYFETMKKSPQGRAHVLNHPYNMEYKKLRLKIVPGLSSLSISPCMGDNSGLMFKAMIGLLPPKPLFDILVEAFFELVNPYFPILDKNAFMTSLEGLPTKVPNQKNAEFQFLALVFVVLRTGQVAIQHLNNDFEAYADVATPQYLSFADHCLSFSDIYSTCSYCGLCCLFLARLCSIITPEDQLDGGDGEKTPAVLGSLIQLAYSLGMDVVDFNRLTTGQSFWAILCIMDAEQVVDIGAPISVTTPLPKLNLIRDSLNDLLHISYKLRSTMSLKYVRPLIEEGYSITSTLKLSAIIRSEMKTLPFDTMSSSEKTDFFYRMKKASLLLRYHANLLIYGVLDCQVPLTKEVFEKVGDLITEISEFAVLAVTSSNLPWLFRPFCMMMLRRSVIYSVWLVTRLHDSPAIKPLTLDLERRLFDYIGEVSRISFPCCDRYFVVWKVKYAPTLLQIIDETRLAAGKSVIFANTSAFSRTGYEISDTASSSMAPDTPMTLNIPNDLFSWFPETNFNDF